MNTMSEREEKSSHPQSLARELALKLLYLLDTTNAANVARQSDHLLQTLADNRDVRQQADELYRGVTGFLADIDARIVEAAVNWQLSRMPYIDRAILRLAVYELLYAHDVPPKVSINEAVDLAKRYSTEKSGSFVNGVLDNIFQTHCPQKV